MVPGHDLRPRTLTEPVTMILAVPEPAVPDLAATLAGGSRPPSSSAVVHVSGALQLAALEPARAAGWEVGSMHPLRPFPRQLPPSALGGITFAVDASTPELLNRLEDLARRLGGTPRRVPDAERTRYHAAAVLGANYTVALAGEAARILQEAGWTRDEAVAALVPLMRGAVDDLAAIGLPRALTGPIRRGDAATVRAHIAELERSQTASLARVYRILGFAALELARESGLNEEAAARIQEALTG